MLERSVSKCLASQEEPENDVPENSDNDLELEENIEDLDVDMDEIEKDIELED
jgi:hypothetical protein